MQRRTYAELEPHLDHLAASPKDVGALELLVCRPARGTRRLLEEGVLDTAAGTGRRQLEHAGEQAPHPLKQVTLINVWMAALLSPDPWRQALYGDQLYVDLDPSSRTSLRGPGSRSGPR